MTPSQSASGFLDQPVIDSTNLQRFPILVTSLPGGEATSAAVRYGVALYWPEDDPRCGPGAYNLSSVILALSASGAQATPPPLVFELWTTANASSPFPVTRLAAYTQKIKYVQLEPDYLKLPLPPGAFSLDTLVSRSYALVFYCALGC